ncbi:hypothetical protein JCM24511_03210 [Saitozyma sp. JCM 24511]|nr:hypothetical protein JCM24511_03210 [Saitozyma sp. JCM 24511]
MTTDMQQAFETRVRNSYVALNAKQFDVILANWVEDGVQRCTGRHALGGERKGKHAISAWLQRAGRLMPNWRFDVENVWVTGTPDKADVLVRWTLTDLDPVGNPWHAHGMSYARFVNGKIVEQDLCLDSQAVAEAFAAKAKAGLEEAAAAPI